jgi:2-polyprenyl-6-methoxyphenol hydroxylase-like FAD-dependent oxidoreductase
MRGTGAARSGQRQPRSAEQHAARLVELLQLRHSADGLSSAVGRLAIETVKARYVVGCDGACSTVRKCIGRALHGDSA